MGESSGLRSKVELVFRPAHADGLLLLGLQENDGVGDFLSLSLSNGFVYFRSVALVLCFIVSVYFGYPFPCTVEFRED